jgi:hypothetical protein
MRVVKCAFLGCLVGCAAHDVRYYDRTYYGVLQNACYPQAQYVWISVLNGRFELPLPHGRRLNGTVTVAGELNGSGTWTGESGEDVHGTVSGSLAPTQVK